VRRACGAIYGDFASPAAGRFGTRQFLLEGMVEPAAVAGLYDGKNSSDISLVIDAWTCCTHRGGFRGLCLCSSDSDFTP